MSYYLTTCTVHPTLAKIVEVCVGMAMNEEKNMKWVARPVRSVCSASANMLTWDVEEIASFGLFGLFGLSANNIIIHMFQLHVHTSLWLHSQESSEDVQIYRTKAVPPRFLFFHKNTNAMQL
jgi:hypothetical protein